MLKLKDLQELLEIDVTSPSGLSWKTSKGKAKIGDVAGCRGGHGYYQVGINGKLYRNHRVVYAMYHSLELEELPKYLDHIDRNPLNNSPLNLRSATKSQSQANKGLQKDNTSGFKGVHWSKKDKRWVSQIRIKGKVTFLGNFTNIEDAARTYQEAAIKEFGEFACLG